MGIRLPFSATLICLLAALASAAFAGDDLWKDVPLNPVKSADKAVELAMMYSGFDELKSVSLPEKAEEIALVEQYVDSITPFLAEQFTDRRVWCIEMDNVILEFDSVRYEKASQHPKNARICIDSLTGKLLEIRLVDVGLAKSDYPCEPSAFHSSKRLRMMREYYEGLPPEPPQRTAASLLKETGIGRIPHVVAMRFLIHSSQLHSASTPSWIIDTYFDPDPYYGGYWRLVYDDSTGERRGMGNGPRCQETPAAE